VGFVNPDLPQVDVLQWRKGSRAERVRPMARHIAERGMGYPDVFYLLSYPLTVAGACPPDPPTARVSRGRQARGWR